MRSTFPNPCAGFHHTVHRLQDIPANGRSWRGKVASLAARSCGLLRSPMKDWLPSAFTAFAYKDRMKYQSTRGGPKFRFSYLHPSHRRRRNCVGHGNRIIRISDVRTADPWLTCFRGDRPRYIGSRRSGYCSGWKNGALSCVCWAQHGIYRLSAFPRGFTSTGGALTAGILAAFPRCRPADTRKSGGRRLSDS